MDAKSIYESLKSAYDKSEKIASTIDEDMKAIVSMKLLHNKSDLEKLLAQSVLIIEYADSDGNLQNILCTSNTALIKVFSLEKENDKKKAAKIKSKGITCKNLDRVKTWNLISNSLNDVMLKNWQLKLSILIRPNPNSVLMISSILEKLLKTK